MFRCLFVWDVVDFGFDGFEIVLSFVMIAFEFRVLGDLLGFEIPPCRTDRFAHSRLADVPLTLNPHVHVTELISLLPSLRFVSLAALDLFAPLTSSCFACGASSPLFLAPRSRTCQPSG